MKTCFDFRGCEKHEWTTTMRWEDPTASRLSCSTRSVLYPLPAPLSRTAAPLTKLSVHAMLDMFTKGTCPVLRPKPGSFLLYESISYSRSVSDLTILVLGWVHVTQNNVENRFLGLFLLGYANYHSKLGL